MPSTCPKCHRVLEEDEICCAQILYTWRCRSCYKLATGFAIPYGRCFLCGGALEIMPERDMGDGMRFRAIHDAVQFEVDLVYFYRLARERAGSEDERLVLDSFYDAALDQLHELEERYRARTEQEMVDVASDEGRLLRDWPFQGIRLPEDAHVAELYGVALALERHARDHFHDLEGESPAGLGQDVCKELEAEEDEHIAMLETELEQLV